MQRPFYSRYLESPASALTSSEGDLLDFLGTLNIIDWEELVQAVVDSSIEALDLFRPPPGDNVAHQAAQFIQRLGKYDRKNFSQALGRLLRVLLAKGYMTPALRRAFDLTSEIADTAVIGFLGECARNNQVDPAIRVEAANTLANHAVDVPDDFWIGLDAVTLPELVPAIVNGLALRSPMLGLTLISRLPKGPSSPNSLDYPLRMAVRKISQSEGWLLRVNDLRSSASPWFSVTLSRVLAFKEFSQQFSKSKVVEGIEPSTRTLRESLSTYLNGGSDTFESPNEVAEISTKFWEEVMEEWAPASKSEAANLRLLDLLPTDQSRFVLAKLLSEFERSEGYDASKGLSIFSSRLGDALWRHVSNSHSIVTLLASSPAEHDRHLFQSYIRVLRKCMYKRPYSSDALRLLVRYSLEQNLIDILCEALGQDHIKAEQCRLILERELGFAEADRILKSVIRAISPGFSGDNPIGSKPLYDLLLEGQNRAIALKLLRFNVSLFSGGDNIAVETLFDLQDDAGPSTPYDMVAKLGIEWVNI